VDGANGAAGKIMLQIVMGSQYVVTEMTPPRGIRIPELTP
jgi:hypothetical protein